MFDPFVWTSSFQFNVFAGVAHIASAIFIQSSRGDIPGLPIYLLQFQRIDELVLKPSGSLNVYVLIATFLLITGSVHFNYAAQQWFRGAKAPGQHFRFAEYAITAPIMIVIIALLMGLREVYILISLAALCSITMVFGAAEEKKDNVSLFIIGLFPIWSFLLILITYLSSSIVDAPAGGRFFNKSFERDVFYFVVEVSEGMEWSNDLKQVPGKLSLLYPIAILSALAGVGVGILFKIIKLPNAASLLFAIPAWTLVSFTVSMAMGVTEVFLLTSLCGLVATSVPSVYILLNKKEWPFSPHALGYIPYTVMWAVLLSFYAVSVSNNDTKPPWFVHVIIFAELFLFSSFALVQLYYVVLSSDTINDYTFIRMDGAYNFLSITSKLLLAWLTYGGITSQSNS